MIDIFEYCENQNKPGAMICIDFEKAFDSISHKFMLRVLEKFNFGPNFIKWMSILYAEPKFKIKNNGWLSTSYNMERGIRQGCSASALIFLLVVEILSTMIRRNSMINGIKIGEAEHKLIQYADDITVCVENLVSIDEVFKTIGTFCKAVGMKLNIQKTKGIWLGELKDLGLRYYNNILWTGKPVKCLGVYIGHNKKKCKTLNWDKKN